MLVVRSTTREVVWGKTEVFCCQWSTETQYLWLNNSPDWLTTKCTTVAPEITIYDQKPCDHDNAIDWITTECNFGCPSNSHIRAF